MSNGIRKISRDIEYDDLSPICNSRYKKGKEYFVDFSWMRVAHLENGSLRVNYLLNSGSS